MYSILLERDVALLTFLANTKKKLRWNFTVPEVIMLFFKRETALINFDLVLFIVGEGM